MGVNIRIRRSGPSRSTEEIKRDQELSNLREQVGTYAAAQGVTFTASGLQEQLGVSALTSEDYDYYWEYDPETKKWRLVCVRQEEMSVPDPAGGNDFIVIIETTMSE